MYKPDRKANTGRLYRQSLFCSTVLIPQHYLWYAAARFAFPGGKLAERTTAGNELNRPVITTPMISACGRLMYYDVKISGARIRTHDLLI